jgi:hypothetical protein
MLARWMLDGMFSVPYATDQDRRYAQPLIDSLIRYPNKPNDRPMSMWLAAGMLWEIWEAKSRSQTQRTPWADNVPPYMKPLVADLRPWDS